MDCKRLFRFLKALPTFGILFSTTLLTQEKNSKEGIGQTRLSFSDGGQARLSFSDAGQASIDTSALAAPDSFRAPIIPIPFIGTMDRTVSADKIVADTAAYWEDYSYLNDIVGARTGAFVRDLGSVGQFSALTLGGLDGRSVAFFHDGIQVNEPLTGTYNSYWSQTEQIERVEVETGPRAFLYGINSTGGAVNIVNRSYKAIRPHTHVRYSESLYEQTFFDGMFSQNITRNLNLTAGLQRFVTDGRFRNSDYDAWGARLKARLNLNNRWNLFFSENYTQTQLGLFGGVNYTSTDPALLFDRLRANIVNGDSYEKITRHDLQLGLAALLFNDTTHVTTLTAYYSSHLRELRNEDNRPNPDTLFIQDNHLHRWQGVKLTQHFHHGKQTLDFGAEIQSRQIIESPETGYRAQISTSAYGKIQLQAIEGLRVAGYTRFDRYLSRSELSYGGDVTADFLKGVKLFAGYSHSFRFPTFQELYWRTRTIDGPVVEFGPERHDLLEAGMEINLSTVFSFRGTLFSRVVREMIVTERTLFDAPFPSLRFSTRERTTYRGINLYSSLRVWHFYAEGTANYLLTMENGIERKLQPQWWATGGIYFWDTLLGGSLELKLGVRGRIFGSQDGMELNPEAMMFVPSSLPPLGAATALDGLLVAHIGSAYVHFIWQNLFDNNYVITPFYPMPDRAVRFGISWVILD